MIAACIRDVILVNVSKFRADGTTVTVLEQIQYHPIPEPDAVSENIAIVQFSLVKINH